MAPRSTRTRARTALMFVVAAALVVAGGGWLALRQAAVLVDRALTIVLGPGERTHRRLTLDRDGQIVVEDLRFRADGAPDAMRVDRLRMETPGWRWFLRNALDPQLHDARLDHLQLSLSGVRVDSGGALPLAELGVFGVASASPWDADGCSPEIRWTKETLVYAGLTPGSPSLRFDYRARTGDLLATTTLETYGVSRVQWVRIGTLPGDASDLLRLATEPGLTRSEHWEVQDQGFVAARNRLCANTEAIDERRFVERHVDAVAHRLATLGLDVDRATRNRYRRFALTGGKLRLSIAPPRPLPASALRQPLSSAAWSDTVTTLDRNGDIGTLRWQRIASSPAPDVAPDTALQPEFADGLETATAASEPRTMDSEIAAVPPPTTQIPAEAQDETQVEALVETRMETPLEMPAEPPVDTQAEAPIAPTATQATPEDTGPISQPPPRATAPAPTAQVAMPPLARFTTPAPESAQRAAILSTARVLPARPPAPSAPKPLSWKDLRALRGRTIEIWTVHSPPRRVEILEFNDDSMRVSFRIRSSGEAVFSIKREAFVRAMLRS